MLAFYLNNKALAIDESSSVKLKFRNPACNFDKISGDIGLGIQIPANEINRSLFGNPEDFERYTNENTREFPNFEIRYSGVLLMKGTLFINSADNEVYDSWLLSDSGSLRKEHREKYIYDSLSFGEEKIFENKADYDPDVDEYACPQIYNPAFFYEKGQKTEAVRVRINPTYGENIFSPGNNGEVVIIDDREYLFRTGESDDLTEAFLRYSEWVVNAVNEDGTIKTPKTASEGDDESVKKNLDVAVVSPMLFLNHVIKKMFKDAKFGIKDNFLEDDPELKKLLIYNNFDITKVTHTGDRSFDIDYWHEEFEDLYINHGPRPRSIGYQISLIAREVNKFYYKELLPQIKLNDFILSIQNLLNVFFHFLPNRKIVNIIDRESILKGETIDVSNYLLGNWKMENEKNNTLKFAFENDDNDIIFSEQWTDLSDFRENEKEPVDTWNDLKALENPEMDEVRFVRETNTYAQYRLWLLENEDEENSETIQKKYIGWRHLSIGFQNAFFRYGKDEIEEIKTEFSTLDGFDEHGIPATLQKGNIRSELFDFNSFSPRLLFYTGNNKGYYQTDNLSLDWEKETTGLLNQRWMLWSRFWSTRQPVTCQAHFSLGMLDYVIRNIYKKFRSNEGEFIIEEITTEFGVNQIGVSEITGYKMNYSPKVYDLDDTISVDDVIWVDETIDMTGLEEFYPLIVNI